MKNLLKVLMIISFVFSCSNSNDSYDLESEVEDFTLQKEYNRNSGCPPNTTASIHYEFDAFRFKRPIYDCERGFWFCTINEGWFLECHDNYTGAVVAVISLSAVDNSSQRTTVAGIIDYENKIVDFYFPIELANVGGNSLSDFGVFNVDDDDNIKIARGITLIPGNYSSRIENTEIIVTVNFQ